MVGNISNYNKTDILRVFLLLEKQVSRAELSKRLELGEGTIRTILNLLKNKKLIKSNRQGHAFTGKGINLLKGIRKNIECPKKIKYSSLYPKLKKSAVLVKNCSRKITFKERDIAIKNMAEAALLFKFDKNLFLPQTEQDIINTKQLNDLFDYEKNDILIITFADSYRTAENSCLSVASSILKQTLRKLKIF